MNLGDLINAVGDNVQFQMLDQCADRMNMNKGVTKVTFGTEQPLGLNGFERMGIVVWLDRAQVKEITAATVKS